MIASQDQVSANVSPETKKLLDKYVKIHGVQENVFIETALLHHLQALIELPSDIIIPPRIVVSKESGGVILNCLDNPPKPTKAMEALFKNDDQQVESSNDKS